MTTLLAIAFDFMGITYYQHESELSVGDKVICETPHGTFIGSVMKTRKPSEKELLKPDFNTLFPCIIREATGNDKIYAENNEQREKEISRTTQKYADELNLGMKVLKSYLDIKEDKVLITFTSDARVDFRELVKILNSTFRLKIELRQIGPRDQARLVGGIGPCGLPLCCSTFLNSFDGISIAMAKNQLLAINIPKLSGQCGKLMCCLKFEDEAYSKIRPLYPKIGEKFDYNGKNYEVTGLNLLTDTITTYNGNAYESFSKEEYERVKKGLTKNDDSQLLLKGDINGNVDLSGFGVKDTANRIAVINQKEEKHKEEIRNKNIPNKNNKPNNNNFQNKNKNNNQNQNQNRNNNQNNFNKGNNPNRGNNHSFGGNKNRSFGGNNRNRNNYNSFKPSNDGFIDVSQIADRSVLDVKPVKKDDQE